MPNSKETYQGSLTRGVLNPRDSRADMVFHVTGLDGSRGSLDDAIDTITGGLSFLVHPDDLTLPLRTATARWIRGADNGDNAEALVFLTFDKQNGGTAGNEIEFSNIADIDINYEIIEWWGDTIDDVPTTVSPESDPNTGNGEIRIPKPKYLTIPIMEISVPAVLSTSPLSAVGEYVGTINSTDKTISGKTFPAKTLRFNGIRQRAVKIDSGASVTYEFSILYSFSYRRDTWRRIELDGDGNGGFKTVVKEIYTPSLFPTFPVS